jgi:hypothetical protein
VSSNKPNPAAYVAYCYGRVLPPDYDEWVRNDLAGKGAARRTLIRVTIPALLLVAPLWLIPTSTAMHLAMATLLLIPFVYFAHALDKIWRAHRLRQHGLDPELVDELTRQREAHLRADYRRRHGHAQDRER